MRLVPDPRSTALPGLPPLRVPARGGRIACVHCEDAVPPFGCGECGTVVSRECRDCHAEVRHGVLAPLAPQAEPSRRLR